MLASIDFDSAANIAALVQDTNLQVRHLRTDGLVAFGRKARTHTKAQIEALAKVIEAFGFIVPVVVDENAKVLAGNARIEAARLKGLTTVPTVEVSHLTSAQKRAFVIADNKLGELAGWDRDTLRVEFEELRELNLDFDLELTGFAQPQIDALLFAGDGAGDGAGDKLPTTPLTPTSRLGDVWLLGDHRLVCGDATHPGVVSELMGGGQARTAFCDPPFNVRISGHVTHNPRHSEFVMASGEMSDAGFTDFLGKVWTRIEDALVPGGLAYLCMDWRHCQHTLTALETTSLEFLNLIVWDKKAGGMGSFYRSRHELIFLAKKPGGEHVNQVRLGSNGRDRSNVWAYEGVNGFGKAKAKIRDLHPTVKPMAMVRDAILDSSAVSDVVLDLFSGSGTTLIAAEVTGRKGRAAELDPGYADTSVMRWQDFTGREATLTETGQTFAEVRAHRAGQAEATLCADAGQHQPEEEPAR